MRGVVDAEFVSDVHFHASPENMNKISLAYLRSVNTKDFRGGHDFSVSYDLKARKIRRKIQYAIHKAC